MRSIPQQMGAVKDKSGITRKASVHPLQIKYALHKIRRRGCELTFVPNQGSLEKTLHPSYSSNINYPAMRVLSEEAQQRNIFKCSAQMPSQPRTYRCRSRPFTSPILYSDKTKFPLSHTTDVYRNNHRDPGAERHNFNMCPKDTTQLPFQNCP